MKRSSLATGNSGANREIYDYRFQTDGRRHSPINHRKSSDHRNYVEEDFRHSTSKKENASVTKSTRASSLNVSKISSLIEPLRIISIFRLLDRDGRGDISKKEFESGLAKDRQLAVLLGMLVNKEENLTHACDQLFSKVDKDGSNEIDIIELLLHCGHRRASKYSHPPNTLLGQV